MSSLSDQNLTGKEYWRSLEELADTPEFRQFVQREFPNRASEWLNGDRRRFLKIMGASFALAGLAGCRRWPAETLAPYAHRPANRDPGTPVYYATGMDLGGIGQGMLVTSVDGRPIKVDGNPTHPLNGGASDIYGQASVLGVYDPDRSRTVMRKGKSGLEPGNWDDFSTAWRKIGGDLQKSQGQGLAFLTGASSSPSVQDMLKRTAKAFPSARFFEYEPISSDNARAGTLMAFGEPMRVVPQLAKARVIVSLDFDFVVGDPLSVKLSRDFSAGRRLTDPATGDAATDMNRLYVIESTFSATGSLAENALHRIPLPAQDVVIATVAIAAGLKKRGINIPELPSLGGALPEPMRQDVIDAIVADLLTHKGECVVVAGSQQPAAVHALAAAMNSALGNTGKTVEYYKDPSADRTAHDQSITNLTAAMRNKEIRTLVMLDVNPAYNAPADLDFASALANVTESIQLSNYVDETARLCTWHLPAAHYLESWGDIRTFDGTISIVQPMIEPIFGGKSVIETLAMLLPSGSKTAVVSGYEIVQRTLGLKAGEWKWKKALFDGYIKDTGWSALTPTLNASISKDLTQAIDARPRAALGAGNIEIVFRPDSKIYDGRFANNGWLQELPDPMTRLTWDNAAVISPKLAKTIGLSFHKTQMLAITVGGKTLKMPAYIMPGQPEFSISLALGYGREGVGSVADGAGFNVYSLRSVAAMNFQTGAAVKVTAESYELANTQDHFAISTLSQEAVAARIPDLIHQATFAEFQKDPSLGHKKAKAVSLWEMHRYDTGYQWAMAVDLTTCTSCSACVVACQAENNIPIVGKQQVMNGREMQWIRIDRYFRGPNADSPEAVHEPILCMQCENAPCEAVCPVGATSHSADGLNMMTYNRCIGTRYCANNCPYKVRRFNFFDYNSGTLKDLYKPNILRSNMNDLAAMQKNPQVSIRMRGVIEKCTYCVQRIDDARVTAERQNRRIRDGEITPACAQACPTQALIFGDMRDKASRVAKLFKQPRMYGILNDELNTRPRTRFMPKISNPNPSLVAVETSPLGTQ